MTRKTKDLEQMERIKDEVAASGSQQQIPDFDEILDTFEDVAESPGYILRPGQLDAILDISSAGYGKANRTLTMLAQKAASDNKLPSTQFGAIRLRYSNAKQSMLCIPEARYVKGQPNLAQVTWSPDGKEMRIDFEDRLKAKGWEIAVGYVFRVEVAVLDRHPKVGSAFVLDHKKGKLKDGASRIRKQNERAAASGGTGGGTNGTRRQSRSAGPQAASPTQENRPAEAEPKAEKSAG